MGAWFVLYGLSCTQIHSSSIVYCGDEQSSLCAGIKQVDNELRTVFLQQGKNSGVFFTNTAINQAEVRRQLHEKSQTGSHVAYLGLSGWESFDFAAIISPTYLFLADINPATLSFHRATIQIIKAVENRFQFVQRFLDEAHEIPFRKNHWLPYVIKQREKQGDRSLKREWDERQKEVHLELSRTGSWLSTDENFNRIKQLIRSKNVYVFLLDITNEKQIEMLNKTLGLHGITLNFFSISNALDWVRHQAPKRVFEITLKNINQILLPGNNLIAMTNVAHMAGSLSFAFRQAVIERQESPLSYADISQEKLDDSVIYSFVEDTFLSQKK
jgi:hypothetical protein